MTERSDPDLTWRDGVPVSTRFDDPYYSLAGGLEEARHVFLAGNDLPERLRPGFHVAELGFGTGLNLAALLIAAGGVPIRFTTFEAWPMAVDDMRRGLDAFGVAGVMARVLDALARGDDAMDGASLSFRLVRGDVGLSLPRWTGRADAWFLDGFSPAKNPQMWTPALLSEMARHTTPGGTAATFTAARAVRDALTAAGFEVTRVAGFGRKRHMTRARLPD